MMEPFFWEQTQLNESIPKISIPYYCCFYNINLSDFLLRKKVVRISKAKYEVIKYAIIEFLKEKKS